MNKAKRNENEPFYEKKWFKKTTAIVTLAAALCTIFGVMRCEKDYSKDIQNAVYEIKKADYVKEDMPDTLLNDLVVKQARELQDTIINIKDRIATLNLESQKSEDTKQTLYRYYTEEKKILALCNSITRMNNLFSVFLSKNPQYATMFDIEKYKKNSLLLGDRSNSIQNNMIEARNTSSLEKKRKYLDKALTQEDMLEFIQIETSILDQIFKYLNKVQKDIKLSN